MKRIGIVLFAVIVFALFFLFRQNKVELSQFNEQEIHDDGEIEETSPKEVVNSSVEQNQESAVQDQSTAALSEKNIEVIKRCLNKVEFPGLNLLRAGDSIADILESLKNHQPLNTEIDVENLHFMDERGEPLRFQILSEEESRFFRVDKEGLPIRISTPKAFEGLAPKAQKQALLNLYKKPVFSRMEERHLKEGSENSAMAIRENDEIIDLQIFFRDSQGTHSLACAVSSPEVLCKCF